MRKAVIQTCITCVILVSLTLGGYWPALAQATGLESASTGIVGASKPGGAAVTPNAQTKVFLPLLTRNLPARPVAPTLSAILNRDGDGTYLVDWSDVTGVTSYELEEDDDSAFTSPTVRYTGSSSQYQVDGQQVGLWHYRVRATNAAGDSLWSNTASVSVIPEGPVLLYEGFESGVWPPDGWQVVPTNLEVTWQLWPDPPPYDWTPPPYEGDWSAACDWDGLNPQDEVLLSPEFQVSSAQLQFYSFGSTFFCRDNDQGKECNLDVWLVVGSWEGRADGSDDILVRRVAQDWTDDMVWSPTSVDLTSYLPAGTPVRVGFEYYLPDPADGWVGDVIGLDRVVITGQ